MSKPSFVPTVRTTTLLDRVGTRRADAEFMAAQLAAADARFMVLADLKEAEKDTMVQQKGYRIYGNAE